MTRIISGIIILLACVAACQSRDPVPDDTIVVGVDMPPVQFDPRLATDAVGSKLKHLVFNGLLSLNRAMELEPDIASGYHSPDASTFEFTLRRGVKFHDGRELTSADVKATYESLLSETLASPYRGDIEAIRDIETPDPTRVVFRLKKPFVPFLTLMTLAVLPKDLAERTRALAATELNGTGPFMIEAMGSDGEPLVLTRNPDYFRGPPRARKIVFRVLQDATLRALELMRGRLDLVQNAVPFALIPALRREPDLSFASAPGVNFNYLAFNFRNPYLRNLKVRLAVAQAIARDKIIRYKLAGLAQPADSLLMPGHWAHSDGLAPFAFDQEGAKKLLDEAGFPDPDGDGPAVRFSLVYKTSTNKDRLEVVRLIAEGLRKIGVGVEVRTFEFGTLSRDIRQGDFDIFSMTWVGVFDPDVYYNIFHSSRTPPAGANRGGYMNPDLDVLLEQARGETDPSIRLDLLHRIQKIVYEDMVYVPLWYDDNFVLTNRRLKDYELFPNAGFLGLVSARKE